MNMLACLVTLFLWVTSANALRHIPSASTSPVLCEAEKRAISPGTEVRVATVRVDNSDKSFRIATYGKNDIVSGSILAHGRWEPSTLEHLKTALADREGSVYLDIGANIGYFVLYVAALGYKVIAVEASQENANLIRYSLCLNPELKSRIKLHHVALAEKRMRCTMASPEGNSGNMNMDCKEEKGRALDFSGWVHWSGRRQREEVVTTVPLDEVVGKDERVDVLKIDTEGFEHHALVGGQKHVLPKIRSVYSEFSPFMLRKQNTDPVAYLELLRKHGLQVHYQDDIVRDFGKLVGSLARDSIVDITASRGASEGSGNRREAGSIDGMSGAIAPGACTTPPQSSKRSVNIGCKPFDVYFHASGDIVSSQISQSGQWDTENTRMVLDALRRPNANGRLLDIGANLGWFSLAAASCGFDAVAIEPFAMNQALVEASTCANGFHNEIKLIKSGLDTVARTCSLYQIPHVNIGDTHSVCSTSVDGEEMKRNFESKGYKKLGITQTTTLDELYRTKALGTRKFDILKIDVEGFESRILLGGNAFMGSELAPESILIEMASQNQHLATGRGGDTLVMIRSMLEAHGYTHAATHNLQGDGFVRAIDGHDILFVKNV